MTREKQARLRKRVRDLERRVTVLRDSVAGAILSLEQGDRDHAMKTLDSALDYVSAPLPDRTPAGAKRNATKRMMNRKRVENE